MWQIENKTKQTKRKRKGMSKYRDGVVHCAAFSGMGCRLLRRIDYAVAPATVATVNKQTEI